MGWTGFIRWAAFYLEAEAGAGTGGGIPALLRQTSYGQEAKASTSRRGAGALPAGW